MADSKQSDTDAAAEGGGKKKIILTLAVAVIAVVAGLATPFLVSALSSGASKSSNDKSEEEQKFEFVPFEEVVANFDDPRLTRYIRIKFSIQVEESDKEELEKQIELKKLILKDWMMTYLGGKNMDSLRGGAAQNKIRREIKDHFNSTMAPDGRELIKGILFEEFNVQ